MSDIGTIIREAAAQGHLLGDAAKNIESMLQLSGPGIATDSITELATAGAWDELNDRFYKTLAFGTGGLRGRSIGKTVTRAENGTPNELGRPQFPCTGTNALNYFNISRATQGLARYARRWAATHTPGKRAALVFAHDTRHFSRDFAELAARVTSECGCDAYLFESPRSTPELSFAVRYLGATAGAVITASHNPPHDNGFKVYFSDGGQVVEPHASTIIEEVNATPSDRFEPVPEEARGNVAMIGLEIDEAYMDRLETLILQPGLVLAQKARLKLVFTSIHGTGGVIIPQMLRRLGFELLTVPQQDAQDGRFPTVTSPNPENAEALTLAIELAASRKADIVLATDPDADRMGAAVRLKDGTIELITGNQIGSLLAWYRIRTFFDLGVLNDSNKDRAVLIKTFVTTDLQKVIAAHFGIRCVETLTGFKYIGEKLTKYELGIPEALRAEYARLPETETRKLRLQHSSFYVCGGEESYGYSGADFVRDKDANGAAVMFAEVAAYAASRDMTLIDLLDEVYTACGLHLEKNGSLVFEGAEGADKIRRLAESYAATPPTEIAGAAVSAIRDFARDTIHDSEGDQIPTEKMLIIELADGGRVAVRPSGTEPKIKYYLFASASPSADGDVNAQLASLKRAVAIRLEEVWTWLKADANARLG